MRRDVHETRRLPDKEQRFYSTCGKPTDPMENSQFDSFLFWRQPIPELELSELEDLGLTAGQPANGSAGRDKVQGRSLQEEAELSEFSSFNFWKTPIGEVDALLVDLNLLL